MTCIVAFCVCCVTEGSFRGTLACMSQQPGALAGPSPIDCVVMYTAGQNGRLGSAGSFNNQSDVEALDVHRGGGRGRWAWLALQPSVCAALQQAHE